MSIHFPLCGVRQLHAERLGVPNIAIHTDQMDVCAVTFCYNAHIVNLVHCSESAERHIYPDCSQSHPAPGLYSMAWQHGAQFDHNDFR